MTQDYKSSAGEHPITPPPELIAKWASSMCGYYEAARWGANQELEACCEWVEANFGHLPTRHLHHFRRPKPSLKEQALADLDTLVGRGRSGDIIRRALEQLPDQPTSEND